VLSGHKNAEAGRLLVLMNKDSFPTVLHPVLTTIAPANQAEIGPSGFWQHQGPHGHSERPGTLSAVDSGSFVSQAAACPPGNRKADSGPALGHLLCLPGPTVIPTPTSQASTSCLSLSFSSRTSSSWASTSRNLALHMSSSASTALFLQATDSSLRLWALGVGRCGYSSFLAMASSRSWRTWSREGSVRMSPSVLLGILGSLKGPGQKG
jgi:hypothetical protein